MGRELKRYQKVGIRFLHDAGGRAILADDMGVGKTVQDIMFYKEHKYVIKRKLVVCPASLVYKWQNDYKEWIGVDAAVITTSKEPLSLAPIEIMSYAIFSNRIHELKNRYDDVTFDEAHALSNSKTKRYKCARLLNVKWMRMLSGTPFLNRPKELWALLSLVRPNQWPSFFKFGVNYCNGHQGKWGWDFTGASNIPELQSRIAPYFLRRLKSDVLDELPPLTREYVPVDIDMSAYTKAIDAYRGNTLKLLGMLRHIVGRGKIDAAVELAENSIQQGDGVVLYCRHLDVLDAIVKALSKYKVLSIQGNDSQVVRSDKVRQFQDGKVDTMVITDAGGEGIDLYAASHIIMVERNWNPGKEEQVEGRSHRIGQDTPVTVTYIIARNTIDMEVHNLIQSKREVINSIISGNDVESIEKQLFEYVRKL